VAFHVDVRRLQSIRELARPTPAKLTVKVSGLAMRVVPCASSIDWMATSSHAVPTSNVAAVSASFWQRSSGAR
jgi:hypothetical protein